LKKDNSKKDKLGNAVVEAICKLLSCSELIECYKNREIKNLKPEKRHTKRKANGNSKKGKGKRSKKRSANDDDDDDDDDNGIEILTQPKKTRKTSKNSKSNVLLEQLGDFEDPFFDDMFNLYSSAANNNSRNSSDSSNNSFDIITSTLKSDHSPPI